MYMRISGSAIVKYQEPGFKQEYLFRCWGLSLRFQGFDEQNNPDNKPIVLYNWML